MVMVANAVVVERKQGKTAQPSPQPLRVYAYLHDGCERCLGSPPPRPGGRGGGGRIRRAMLLLRGGDQHHGVRRRMRGLLRIWIRLMMT
jgi:hypothetical protein